MATPNDNSNAMIMFVHKCQEMINEHFATKFPMLTPDVLTVDDGRRYWKIVKNGSSQRTVYAFVEKETGAVFKPATWKAPAKWARGNIHEPNFMDFMTPYGPVYLK